MTEPPFTRRSLTRAIVPALAAAAVAATVALVLVSKQPPFGAAQPPAGCVTPAPAGIGGPIALTAAGGRVVTQADFAGRPAILYFGYTHCPDVCPVTMYAVKDALTALGSPRIGTAMITVDPERDTPDLMGQYAGTGGFPAGLVGLSGAPEQVNAAIQAFGVTAFKAAPQEGGYNVNHTSFLYILDQSWRLKGIMSTIGKTPQDIASCIRASLGVAASARA